MKDLLDFGRPHPLQNWVDGVVMAVFETYCPVEGNLGMHWQAVMRAIDDFAKNSPQYSQWLSVGLYDRIALIESALTKWSVQKVFTSYREQGIRYYRLRTGNERSKPVPK